MITSSRLVGIDFGKKRVGIAIADPLRMFSQPYGTFSPDDSIVALDKLLATDGIDCFIVGWPLSPDGLEGKATEFVQPYINRLKNRYKKVEIIKWDERFSSERAKEAIYAAGVSKKKRREKGRIDAAAAAIILQEYLDNPDAG